MPLHPGPVGARASLDPHGTVVDLAERDRHGPPAASVELLPNIPQPFLHRAIVLFFQSSLFVLYRKVDQYVMAAGR